MPYDPPMIRKTYIAAVLALGLSAGAASAGQVPEDMVRQMVSTFASLFGFSPQGRELWIDHAMQNRSDDRYARSTELFREIGEQLSLEQPDRARLDALGTQQAQEAARLERLEHDQLMDIAFRLSDEDRRILGRRMVSNAEEDLVEGPSKNHSLP